MSVLAFSTAFALILLERSTSFFVVMGASVFEVLVVYLVTALWLEKRVPLIACWVDGTREAQK